MGFRPFIYFIGFSFVVTLDVDLSEGGVGWRVATWVTLMLGGFLMWACHRIAAAEKDTR
jgi:hypothetical protein